MEGRGPQRQVFVAGVEGRGPQRQVFVAGVEGHPLSDRRASVSSLPGAAGEGGAPRGSGDQAELPACGQAAAAGIEPLRACPADEAGACLHPQVTHPVRARGARDREASWRAFRSVIQVTGDGLLATAHRIHAQQRQDKNKVYSVHEPEVECIAKGKAGKPYEFGNKVSVAVTSRGGWLVGAKSFTGNPYDGHTLAEQMKQVRSMIGDGVGEAHVDMGYRGHDYQGQATVHVDKRSRGRTPRPLWRRMKRRAAIEPSIGHLKNEHRLERNRLRGTYGDAINALLAAAAMNFHKLLGAFWLYFLRRLLGIWSELQLMVPSIGPQVPCKPI